MEWGRSTGLGSVCAYARPERGNDAGADDAWFGTGGHLGLRPGVDLAALASSLPLACSARRASGCGRNPCGGAALARRQAALEAARAATAPGATVAAAESALAAERIAGTVASTLTLALIAFGVDKPKLAVGSPPRNQAGAL